MALLYARTTRHSQAATNSMTLVHKVVDQGICSYADPSQRCRPYTGSVWIVLIVRIKQVPDSQRLHAGSCPVGLAACTGSMMFTPCCHRPAHAAHIGSAQRLYCLGPLKSFDSLVAAIPDARVSVFLVMLCVCGKRHVYCIEHGWGTHSLAGSRLESCQVPETVCCRSRDLSPGAFLRGARPWQ